MTNKHLEVENRERQRVFYATQLLSGTNATALRFLFPECEKQADFVQLINDAFDLFNVSPHKPSISTSAYGLHLEEQDELLDKLYDTINTMRVIRFTKTGKKYKGLYPFQNGILMSINALKGLFTDLEDDFHITHIYTTRLNQDVVENSFSILRGIGGTNTNPTAIEIK